MKTNNTSDIMNAINVISAHLYTIASQQYTVCPSALVERVVAAGALVGLNILGGLYDTEGRTQVLYVD